MRSGDAIMNKRGYFVTADVCDGGFAVVAHTAKEAKRIVMDSGEVCGVWIDIRVYWQRDADVVDVPVGMVSDAYKALVLGLYSHLDECPCDACGYEGMLHRYEGMALCAGCIDWYVQHEHTNSMFERLKQGPCAAKDLPYRGGYIPFMYRRRFRRIKVCGKRTNTCNRTGRFITVYYLEGDMARAVDMFVGVNAKPLAALDLSVNCALDNALPKDLVRMIKDRLRS